MSLVVAATAGFCALVACAWSVGRAPRAAHWALGLLVAMVPAPWAGATAVEVRRALIAEGTVRPDAWVRDDSPATIARLPAVAETAPREEVVTTSSSADPSHYNFWSRSAGTFRSGPINFSTSESRDHGVSESEVATHGWTCRSYGNPAGSRSSELRMRQSSDREVIAFDCHLLAGRERGRSLDYALGEDAPAPLVLRLVRDAPPAVRGSPLAAVAGLLASLLLCVATTNWRLRPPPLRARSAVAPVEVGGFPFRRGPAIAFDDAAATERALRARHRAVVLIVATALVGSLLALRIVAPQ
jgi:hypothetical protein